MYIAKALASVAATHKKIAHEIILASTKTITIYTSPVVQTIVSSGASMFNDLSAEKVYDTFGPFSCTWIDADAARVGPDGSALAIVRKSPTAEIVVKLWLEDVLVTSTDPYGETYFDRASHLISGGKRYQILNYDRYGIGVVDPYIIAVALKGTFTAQ